MSKNDSQKTTDQTNSKDQVFLGGSCDPTTWRQDIAMPMFDNAGVAYYNPQVADWHSGLMALEAAAKEESNILLFVIDGQTRAIASILESVEYTMAGRKVVLVINQVPDGTVIAGQVVTGRELKDLNRAREYLGELADRHDNVTVYEDVASAVQAILDDRQKLAA
ncbi:nucleoside 2-deoxyribosyltransferase domain-containing protein [Candidatus Nomurabacteria bacterium]|nr:nucleoside 2-deoxyribosyltransferase domain-containing protein [Candidatus Kaiserbacteria bacterium]MCB9814628.1 nucleoside 2-deoxyribosyltransferase domain-containing protein [Candidatus Nomurabacteria bacterium]